MERIVDDLMERIVDDTSEARVLFHDMQSDDVDKYIYKYISLERASIIDTQRPFKFWS